MNENFSALLKFAKSSPPPHFRLINLAFYFSEKSVIISLTLISSWLSSFCRFLSCRLHSDFLSSYKTTLNPSLYCKTSECVAYICWFHFTSQILFNHCNDAYSHTNETALVFKSNDPLVFFILNQYHSSLSSDHSFLVLLDLRLWCLLWVFHIWPLLCWGVFPIYLFYWEFLS